MREDFGQANDLAAKYPKKLEEMKALFMEEAKKNNVLPIDDRRGERLNPEVAGRADIMPAARRSCSTRDAGHDREQLHQHQGGVLHDHGRPRRSRQGAQGVLLSQAGQFGGWSLYVKDGKPKYVYNWLAREQYVIEGTEKLPAGKVTLVFDFAYDGGGLHKGATGSIMVNGKKVGQGRIEKTMGSLYSLAAETADVGKDAFSPVTKDYDPWNNAFTGTIQKITVQLRTKVERSDDSLSSCRPRRLVAVAETWAHRSVSMTLTGHRPPPVHTAGRTARWPRPAYASTTSTTPPMLGVICAPLAWELCRRW